MDAARVLSCPMRSITSRRWTDRVPSPPGNHGALVLSVVGQCWDEQPSSEAVVHIGPGRQRTLKLYLVCEAWVKRPGSARGVGGPWMSGTGPGRALVQGPVRGRHVSARARASHTTYVNGIADLTLFIAFQAVRPQRLASS